MEVVVILLLTFLGSIAGLVGGVVFLIKENWARKLSSLAVPFAAGVLLSVSLLDLIPEAERQIGEKAYLLVLLALLGSFIFEQYFAHLHHHEDRKATMIKSSVPLVLFGDTVHNFIDGATIVAAYLTQPLFGLVVATATFLHETPHEIGDFGVLMRAGWSRSKTFLLNFISAAATFPGGFLVYFSSRDGSFNTGALLAISAGVFLFLGASDFLPEVGENHSRLSFSRRLAFLLGGVSIMYLVSSLVPEP